MQSDAMEQRLTIARKVAAEYAKNPKAEIVMIAGSTSHGWADAHSDLEVDVFWSEPPTDEERHALIAAVGGTPIHVFPFEEDEWAESFAVDGVKIDTSTFLTAKMEEWLADVCDRFDTDTNKQLLVSAVLHGLPLVGHEKLEAWKRKASAYPDGLAKAMVQEHLESFERAYYYSMLADRDDALMWHDVLVQASKQMMGVLLGLNRIYLINPRYKWLDQTIAMMQVAPRELGPRLRLMLTSAPLSAREQLYSLLEETMDLVEAHMPELGPITRPGVGRAG